MMSPKVQNVLRSFAPRQRGPATSFKGKAEATTALTKGVTERALMVRDMTRGLLTAYDIWASTIRDSAIPIVESANLLVDSTALCNYGGMAQDELRFVLANRDDAVHRFEDTRTGLDKASVIISMAAMYIQHLETALAEVDTMLVDVMSGVDIRFPLPPTTPQSTLSPIASPLRGFGEALDGVQAGLSSPSVSQGGQSLRSRLSVYHD